jgi:hypothetical protein
MKEERYARVCDVTGKGMNEGWCWGDGSFYTATLEVTISELRKDYPDKDYLTDDELLEQSVDNEFLYWTEWYDEELEEGDTYFDEEGNEHEI